MKWEIDFADLQIKGRGVKGNIVSKHNILRVELKEKGVSTLKPRSIWFDPIVMKLNVDDRGDLLGAFRGDDKLLIINSKGDAKTVTPDLSLHFDAPPAIMERWVENRPITAVYLMLKKNVISSSAFLIENENKEDNFLKEDAKLLFVSTEWRPVIELIFTKPRGGDPLPNKRIVVEEFIGIKGFKALGNQLDPNKLKEVVLAESLPYEEADEEPLDDVEVVDPNQLKDSDDDVTNQTRALVFLSTLFSFIFKNSIPKRKTDCKVEIPFGDCSNFFVEDYGFR